MGGIDGMDRMEGMGIVGSHDGTMIMAIVPV